MISQASSFRSLVRTRQIVREFHMQTFKNHLRQRGDSGIHGPQHNRQRGGRQDNAIGNRHWKDKLDE